MIEIDKLIAGLELLRPHTSVCEIFDAADLLKQGWDLGLAVAVSKRVTIPATIVFALEHAGWKCDDSAYVVNYWIIGHKR